MSWFAAVPSFIEIWDADASSLEVIKAFKAWTRAYKEQNPFWDRSLTRTKCFFGSTSVCPIAIGYLSKMAMNSSSSYIMCEGAVP